MDRFFAEPYCEEEYDLLSHYLPSGETRESASPARTENARITTICSS